ncbi:hypothetical protein DFH28DRAFT_1085723 [Melampsora americana]|nr:hypothetical protein DFH28DRAFT_1085723 [Melampsora americana]
MIYGSARNQLTRRQYEAIRSAVSLAHLKLPNYKTLKALLNRAKKQLGLKLNSTISPLGNPCHSLPLKDLLRLDLAKPHVAGNLAFYPAIEKDGLVKEFMHCEKWLNGFPAAMRAPMVYSEFGHFYLYEPVQLGTGRVVVPTHFYYYGNDLVAKCLQLQLVDYDHPRESRMEIFKEEKVGNNSVSVFNIMEFRNTFENIILPNGAWLKDIYGDALYRINSEGRMVDEDLRDWHKTERVTKQMWTDSQQPHMASKIDAVQKSYGLKDTMLQPFLDKIRKVQREHNLSEAQRLAMDYERRFGDRMFNPFFRLDGLTARQRLEPAGQFLMSHRHEMQEVCSATLQSGQLVQVGDFVAVLTPYLHPPKWIGRIRSIWSSIRSTSMLSSSSSPILSLDWGAMLNKLHPWYGMRALKIQSSCVYIYLNEVRCSINVQHNCYDSHCKSVRSAQPIDQLILRTLAPKESVVHQQTDLFIINSASLYNGQAHHEWAYIEPQIVEPETWAHATQSGLRKWKNESLNKK